jgi:hypothetical protein
MLSALAKAGWVGEAAAIDATYVKARGSAQGGKGGRRRRPSAAPAAARPPGRDRPGAVVLLGPERAAGMDEQHLGGGVGQAVRKDAGAALRHGRSCEVGP